MPKVFKLQQLGTVIQQILNAVSGKAEQSDLSAHTGDGDVHVSTTEKNRWNDTYTKNQVDDRIEQGGKVKTVSVNGGDAVQPDEHGNIDIEVPTDLKDLNDDATHRTVTDAEKTAWSGKQPAGDYATRTELAEELATKQDEINDLEAIRGGAGKGATSIQGVKMEGDDDPLTPDGDGVVTIPQPVIPDSVTSVLVNNELVLQTPDGQSVKGKVGITTGADGLLHLTLTDEEGNTYSSPIAGLSVNGNALQYSNDGQTWTTVQTFGKLAIKYVQASDPASGDEGDLALVGTTNAYVLKVYVGGSWVSVCDFGTLDLTSDGITMAGEDKTLTEKMREVDLIRNNNADSDLDVADENGNVALRLSGGHIKTKEFDSREIADAPLVADDDSNADLDFSDEQGNVALQVINGHIRTKNFDSENLEDGAINLPDYWKSYLNTKVASIKAEEDALGRNGATFIFFSDVHWVDNYKQSPSIIKYILRHTHIKDVICGGDLISLYGTKTAKVAEMKEFCDAVSNIPCINIIGNHDYNTSDQPAASWDANRITPQEHYRIAMATSEREVEFDQLGTGNVDVIDYDYNPNPSQPYSKNNGRYPEYFGYVDNKSQKIRYIFLDSTCVHVPTSGSYIMTGADLRISDNQLIWMQDKITELANGWTVVVFSHIGLATPASSNQNATTVDGATSTADTIPKVFFIGGQIINAIDAIYDEAASNGVSIAGIICGHVHRDLDLTLPKGYVFISTTCDARKSAQAQNDTPNGGASNGGDTDEQAIDVFFLDTENKTIKAKRVGVGEDRTFNYQ